MDSLETHPQSHNILIDVVKTPQVMLIQLKLKLDEYITVLEFLQLSHSSHTQLEGDIERCFIQLEFR